MVRHERFSDSQNLDFSIQYSRNADVELCIQRTIDDVSNAV
ncbi:hypothetical protein VPMS16_943 [Vibrio sp. 16]|nr:hypothetical protein VPMS16_943 [Vibrio sp. 16]